MVTKQQPTTTSRLRVLEEEYCGAIPYNPTKQELEEFKKLRSESPEAIGAQNLGYQAQAFGKDLVKNNPYHIDNYLHWEWRKGFLEAFKDSN